MARRSPPKQKFLPAPVSTTARTEGLRPHVIAAASRSIAICRFRVFDESGRLSVTSVTAPRLSTCTVGADIDVSLLFVRRDRHAQPGERRRELDLAGETGLFGVMRELVEQLTLVRLRRGELV